MDTNVENNFSRIDYERRNFIVNPGNPVYPCQKKRLCNSSVDICNMYCNILPSLSILHMTFKRYFLFWRQQQ